MNNISDKDKLLKSVDGLRVHRFSDGLCILMVEGHLSQSDSFVCRSIGMDIIEYHKIVLKCRGFTYGQCTYFKTRKSAENACLGIKTALKLKYTAI